MRLNFDKEKLYFIGCLHFNHANIIKYCNRPFLDVQHMNEQLIENWNNKVPKDGKIFLLGDVGFGSAIELREILDRLNGDIYLINGNHDSPARNKNCIDRFSVFNSYQENHTRFSDYYELQVKDNEAKNGKNQKIILFHYPILNWVDMYSSWHLHSHTHGSIQKDEVMKKYYYDNKLVVDVGADACNFTPLSYHDIKQIMNSKTKKEE